METRELLKKEVETKFAKLAVETTPGTLDRYPAVPSPITVDTRELLKKEVETTPGILERYPAVPRPTTVDTRELLKNEVETRFCRFGDEIKGRIEDANSLGSIKLLIYFSRPAVVEIRFGEESKSRRFAVETKFKRL